MYPLRFPFAEFFGAIGVPLLIVVRINCDPEAKVYVATSPDVPGLVVEAASLDQLKEEVEELLPELLIMNNPRLHKQPQADVSFRHHLQLA